MKQSSIILHEHQKKACVEDKNQYKDDSATWAAFKMGNESAFIYIYETYFDKLFVYGHHFTRDEGIVKDAIQDLFIELRKNRLRLGDTDSIKFYLFKCLKRRIIKESSHWFYKCEEFSSELSFNFSFSHEQILIDRQLNKEKMANLNKAIQALSPRKREVIYYFYYEGLNYRQIKEIMQLSDIKSARNLLYKAIDFLRENIK